MKPNFRKILEFIETHSYILMYGAFFLFLLIKYYLTSDLSVRSAEQFLETSRFMSSDSFNWFSNGLRIFETDEISFRQPGYWLIIKTLDWLNLFFLHNLLSSLSLLVIIISVCESLKILKVRKAIIIPIALLIFSNGNFQTFALYALSDLYAVALFSLAILFYLKGNKALSFLFLGVSALFQYFAFIAAVPQFIHWVLPELLKFKNNIKKNQIVNFIKRSLFYIFLVLLPNLPWFIYRYIEFGSPLYSKVDGFSLVSPNINSFFFYLVNSYTMFGLFVLVFFAGLILIVKKNMLERSSYLYLFSLFIATFIFWIVLYEWDDRRFLLYFIPFIYIIGGLNLSYIAKNIKAFVIAFLILISVYPTFYTFDDFFNSSRVPIIHRKAIYFESVSKGNGMNTIKPEFTFIPVDKFKIENIPFVSSFVHWNKLVEYRRNKNPQYVSYVEMIEETKANNMKYCLINGENNTFFDYYVMNSIMLIKEGISIERYNEGCMIRDQL